MGNQNFAKRVQELRIKKGWTLENLGEKVGLKKTAIQNWEKNGAVPNDEILLKLSELFEQSIDYLLGNDQIMNGSQRRLFRSWNNMNESDRELFNSIAEDIIKRNAKGKK